MPEAGTGPAENPFAAIAVPGPHRETFTYRVPATLEDLVRPGHRVLVPFGKRRLVGLVFERTAELPPGLDPSKLRAIEDVLDAAPVIDETGRELCAWVARYYHAPLGEVLRLAGPPGASWARGPRQVRLSVPAEGETVDLAALPEKCRDVYYAALELAGPAMESAVSVAELSRRAGREGLHHRLRTLERSGALAIEFEKARMGATAREKWRWEALELPETELEALRKGAPRQAEIWQLLRERGPAEAAELGKEQAGVGSALRTLEQKGLVSREKFSERRDPWGDLARLVESEGPPKLTGAQARAVQSLDKSLGEDQFAPALLWGVTGSGKTEVYLRSIERALSLGKTALVLVPEIALTPRLAARFRARFGESLAVLHSGLAAGERYDEWQRLRSGAARVCVGVRSALFAPLRNVGLIVVDEEHEDSYKQEEMPAYSARDGAVKRAQIEGATIVLGSATPSLESLANVRAGRYRLLELPERVGGRPFPELEIVDLRSMRGRNAAPAAGKPSREPGNPLTGEAPEEEEGPPWFLSDRLDAELRANLERGEQTILFLNRRGFAGALLCRDCGHQPECPNCAVRLRVHNEGRTFLCHYCAHEEGVPALCPKCGGTQLRPAGLGTQQLEQVLTEHFPEARIARLDRDALSRKGDLARILERMSAGKIDILLGTQMVAKGHDFPNVTLVAVLLADLAWAIPDFRAEERTWQQLAQVAGRAGRGELPGRVLVQTFSPDAPALAYLGEDKLWEFADAELGAREAFGYPPSWRLAVVHSTANREEEARAGAELARRILDPVAAEVGTEGLRLVGPAPCPISRLRGRWRWQLLVKAADARPLQQALRRLESELDARRGASNSARVSVDVDPRSLL